MAFTEPDYKERRRRCRKCGNRGLIAVRYRDHSPWDIAVCDCPAGQVYRKHPGFVRARNPWVTAEHQVAWLEQFVEPKPVAGEVYKG